MTTATKLTLLRVIMIPAFMAVFLLGYNWVALAIFILADRKSTRLNSSHD